jgi:hypothetical protein
MHDLVKNKTYLRKFALQGCLKSIKSTMPPSFMVVNIKSVFYVIYYFKRLSFLNAAKMDSTFIPTSSDFYTKSPNQLFCQRLGLFEHLWSFI